MRELRLTKRHRPAGMRANNRAENSHLPIRRRERKQQNFKSQGSPQRFHSIHATVYNNSNVQQHLISPTHAGPLPGGGAANMGGGDRRGMNVEAGQGPLRLGGVTLTAPADHVARPPDMGA